MCSVATSIRIPKSQISLQRINSGKKTAKGSNFGNTVHDANDVSCHKYLYNLATLTGTYYQCMFVKIIKTRMWANAQRDGRPAEYRWRPLFNAAKFGWCPLLECRVVMLPRRETHWNLQGCPKLPNGSQLLVGRSSLYYQDMWRRYCCLTSFSDCRYMP